MECLEKVPVFGLKAVSSVALAADSHVFKNSGRVFSSGDLSDQHGFMDADDSPPHWRRYSSTLHAAASVTASLPAEFDEDYAVSGHVCGKAAIKAPQVAPRPKVAHRCAVSHADIVEAHGHNRIRSAAIE